MLPRKRSRVVADEETLAPNYGETLAHADPSFFNDPSTADVLLRLHPEGEPEPVPVPVPDPPFLDLHLHTSYLRRSPYFAALLSNRWLRSPNPNLNPNPNPNPPVLLSLKVTPASSPETYVTVLRLLYSPNFADSIPSASAALALLPVALELLFDELVAACVRFLEAVPWTEQEEEEVLAIVPLLREDESRDLLARILPADSELQEEMLHTLIQSAIHSHPRVATVKAFVAKLLRDHSCRDSVRRVLDRSFRSGLEKVRGLLAEYASPNLRATAAGEDDGETEAMQRLSLHSALVNTRHLLWLVERMVELRVGDVAAGEWGEQGALAADLQKTFRDDAWRNIAPGLPSLVMRCTASLVNAVAAGSILAPRQVRMKLVKNWLPVLNVCRDTGSSIPSSHQKLYQELEGTFLRIISTLPMSDAQELLQECLSFCTPNVDDCPHLVGAFKTWFRRAKRSPHDIAS